MQEYGYLWEQILPLTKETAIELFEQDLPLLMLYPDNLSDVVENKEVLMEHGGLFGIERSDWEDYLVQDFMQIGAAEGN